MKKIGKAIAKGRFLIFILALALLVPVCDRVFKYKSKL